MITFALLLAAHLSLYSPAAWTMTVDCSRPLAGARDDSAKNGLLMHGEHWADLILRQAGRTDEKPLTTYLDLLFGLSNDIERGLVTRVNEKIDGSPAVVFGFDGRGIPFVAYKGHFTRRAQSLVTKVADARAATDDPNSGLTQVLASLIKIARGPLGKVPADLRDYVFQGDLLFTEGDDRRVVEDDAITLRPNVVPYVIGRDHPYFAAARDARAGVVIHTVGRRAVDAKGRLSAEPLESSRLEERIVAEFVRALVGTKIFAVHPWRDEVSLEPETTRAQVIELQRRIQDGVDVIQFNLDRLGPEFRAAFPKFEGKFRTFLNVGLRAPNDGGFYRLAATGHSVDAAAWIAEFGRWLGGRNEIALANRFAEFLTEFGHELEHVLEAYGTAIHLQALVTPFLKSATTSKLGGGEVEGLMLKTDDALVKMVDRLGFTMRNVASGGPRAMAPRSLERLPKPFDEWRPGLGVLVLKGQPIHAGHAEMVRRAVEMNGGRPLVVFASEKQPNLRARDWKGLRVADTKAAVVAKDYRHVFDRKFRAELAARAFDGEVTFVMGNQDAIWSYLTFARAHGLTGKLNYFVGEKEGREGRYAEQIHEFRDNLDVREIPMQAGGISATDVRRALRIAATAGRRERAIAMATLDRAFGFVGDDLERRRVIRRTIARWRRIDRLASAALR